MKLNQLSLFGESASPFIDEWDGLTSERERVRMFLSLAAYDGGYRTTVDAHNTVDVTVESQMHVGGSFHLLWPRQTSARPPYC